MSAYLDSILPAEVVPASIDAARCLLIYSEYKTGKTAIGAWLSRNRKALWLDYEDGGEAVPGVKINVIKTVNAINKAAYDKAVEEGKRLGIAPRFPRPLGKLAFLKRLWKELAEEEPRRYDYLIHDKINQLEDWAEWAATETYCNSPIGAGYPKNASVLELPNGGGYRYLRQEFLDIWNLAVVAAPRQIFWCSQKLKFVGGENKSFDAADLDLCGKVRAIAAGQSDAPAVMYRELDGSNTISFMTNDPRAFCGCRVPRLEGKRFKLSWIDKETGELMVDWEKLYPDGK